MQDLLSGLRAGAEPTRLRLLALCAQGEVTVSELTEMLWPARLPKSPAGAVQAHLSRLRAILGPGLLHRGPAGYRLELADDELDLAEFRLAVRRARLGEAVDTLRVALRQWRGEPLADVPELRGQPLVTALAEERVQAALLYADTAAATGESGRVLPLLRELTAANPLHEPLHARAVTALAASGLQAEALALHERIRTRLRDELGMNPGAELAGALQRVLQPSAVSVAEAPGPPRPAGLPPAPHYFTGRREAVRRLDDRLDAGEQAGAGVTTVLTGATGIGKTALALHWAHRVRHRFPDGQLHADLRGFHPSGRPAEPGKVLASFLSALGETRIPESFETRLALYRSRLDGRRMLVVLDNARDAEQVRPLLPSGRRCLAVVTSRNPLAGLVAADGAHPVTLGLPSAAEATELLTARLGYDRALAEPRAVEEIVAACGRLPLALAVTAARAVINPATPLTAVARLLRHQRLDGLTAGDRHADVRAALSWSYAILDEPAARLFRLLALTPPGEVPTETVAALAGTTAVREPLGALVRARLIEEPSPDWYVMHELPRAYAKELATRAT